MFQWIAKDFWRLMRSRWVGVLSLVIIGGAIAPLPMIFRTISVPLQAQAANPQLVDIQAVNPKIRLDLRYATTNNFTHHKLYAQARCLLRVSTANRLSRVQTVLERQGLGLQVYDCYRPLSVQKAMWALVKNADYVADPAKGSRHDSGSAVDLTLVDRAGKVLPMPSGFDEFSERAHLNYRGGSAQTLGDRQRLQEAMHQQGFLSLPSEWWHFDDPDWQRYPLLDIPVEQVKG